MNGASGSPDPPTSQHALRQARQLAKNLGGKPGPYAYRMIGQGATLGRYKGVAEIFGIRLRGFPGWFATRSYHLYQLPLFTRKLRVVTDWTVAMFFRRDIAQLGTLGHPRSAWIKLKSLVRGTPGRAAPPRIERSCCGS